MSNYALYIHRDYARERERDVPFAVRMKQTRLGAVKNTYAYSIV